MTFSIDDIRRDVKYRLVDAILWFYESLETHLLCREIPDVRDFREKEIFYT